MKSDELEQILDEALASYSLHEPRPGLARRVINRTQLAPATSASRWWWAVLPIAAALVCLAIALLPAHQELPPRAWKVAVPPPPVMTAKAAPNRPPRAKAARLPKLDTFPSPAPLTPAEQALIAFAQRAPSAAVQLAQPDTPLVIEAIAIPPLEIDGVDIGENK